jgi:MoxR-like ATPase
MITEVPAFIGIGNETELGRELPAWEVVEEDVEHDDAPTAAASGQEAAAPAVRTDHPSGYLAHADVVAAVNTALLLGKPLLLTGNPGTGKTQLADRIAWELGLGAVRRFEAQSISEAQDLFYRFDLVGQLAQAHLQKAGVIANQPAKPSDFVAFGPLGRALLRGGRVGERGRHPELLKRAFPRLDLERWQPRRSVVLIDEIDKASRDFPNDLLNAIDRLEFRIREIPESEMPRIRVAHDAFRPIVLITSNGEREIPAPFLRRCVYCHIPDPSQEDLRKIIRNRVFGGGAPGELPALYEALLSLFDAFRGDDHAYAYRVGTSELVDWTRAVERQRGVVAAEGFANANNSKVVFGAFSAVAKNHEDRDRLLELFRARGGLVPQTK